MSSLPGPSLQSECEDSDAAAPDRVQRRPLKEDESTNVKDFVERVERCLLCSGTLLKHDSYASWKLNLLHPLGVARCADCQFRFLSPRPTAKEYGSLYRLGVSSFSSIYPHDFTFYEREIDQRRDEYRKKLGILRRFGAGSRLLEIGSCTGLFLNEARRLDFEVTGIEPSEDNARIARDRYDINLRIGSVEDQNFPDGYFDVVFSSHVFEHLLDPVGVARKVSQWLRPGGLHMMEVPNQFEMFSAKLRRMTRIDKQITRSFLSIHHPVFFSQTTLPRLAKLTDCELLYLRGVYTGSTNAFRNPKGAAHKLMAHLVPGPNIEMLALRRPTAPQARTGE